MGQKVTYTQLNHMTQRWETFPAEIVGPFEEDAETGEFKLVVGQSITAHERKGNLGARYLAQTRRYQDLSVNFAKPAQAPRFATVTGVSLRADILPGAAHRQYYELVADTPAGDESGKTEAPPAAPVPDQNEIPKPPKPPKSR